VNAFSSYATGGVQGFHATKRARATSPSGGSSQSSLERKPGLNILNSNDDGDSEVEGEEEKAVSFGEKLRAGRDDENEGNSDEDKKLVLTEQEGAFTFVFVFQVPLLMLLCSHDWGGRRGDNISGPGEIILAQFAKPVERTRNWDAKTECAKIRR